jgi:hypothetical protein
VAQRRQTSAHVADAARIEIGGDDAGTLVEAGQHFAPGVDDHAVAVGHAAVGMAAALGRSQQVALVLDGAGAQQQFPMGAARGLGKGRRQHQQVELAQGAKHFREAQIVADAQADEQACLERAFRAKPAATRPLASDKPASEGDLHALGAVEDGCIQVSTLAAAITAGAADSFTSMNDQQRTCLNDSVTSLSEADRVTLLVGLVVPQSLSDIGGAEMGRVTNGILEGCQLSVAADGTQTAPTTTPLTTGP